jgi:membrane-associated phospholipid phosphatase
VFSAYCGVFFVLYLQARINTKIKCANFLLKMLQTIVLFWPIYCSVSRIHDSRHHIHDVIVGSAIGLTMAFWNQWINETIDFKNPIAFSFRQIIISSNTQENQKHDIKLHSPGLKKTPI